MSVKTATVPALVLVLSSLTASRSEDPPKAPEWDAKFVKMVVPESVAADQVFAVKITVKNTGTETWREAPDVVPTSLRSESPRDNETWGTKYIIQGQGTVVAPGKEFTYQSNLRAPSRPGKYAFQWRVHGKPGLFGEPTAKAEITVTEAPKGKTKPAAVPPADQSGKRPLTFEDFEYLGSFKVPEVVGKGGAGYSESGLAFRKLKDGSPRLFLNYNHPGLMLFETDVPELVKFEKGDAAGLKTAAVKKEWGPLAHKDAPANGGLWWDEETRLLYWTRYHGYWTGGDIPVLHATKLGDDGTMTAVGSWTVPNQKWHWGGVTRLPKSFADRYTGGKTLALGFGGYFSIVAPCSRGPALSAFADPDPAAAKVGGAIPLLGYADGAAARRPGDYFNANCGFWNDAAESREFGTWTFRDFTKSGVLIDLPDRQGYVAFTQLGTGRLGYDYGATTNAGEAQYWYFYDTRELGAVAQGKRKSGTLVPYLMQPDPGMGGMVTGAYFDEGERKLYVIRMYANPIGTEHHPLVHVYRVKK